MATIEKRSDDNGNTSYRVKVRLRGHPQQTATFARLTDARKWGAQTEAAIHERRHFKNTEAHKRTVAEMINRYVDEVLPRKGRQSHTQGPQLDFWKRELGAYMLRDLTPAMVGKVRDKLAISTTSRGTMQPATVVRYLAALSHCCTIAVKEWQWLDMNPVQSVTKPREPRGRVRFLSDDERTKLLQACRESDRRELYIIVVLALSTGARRGEILNLTWPQIDFDRRVAILHETKNGERRVLPLTGLALDLLDNWSKFKRPDTPLLFPGTQYKKRDGTPSPMHPIDITFSFRKACEAAALEDFKFHDLRHSAASYLAMNGASLAEIAEVLGHKTLAMVKRYAHLSEAHTAGVVERMNNAIFGELP